VTAQVVTERRGQDLELEVLVAADGTRQLGRTLDATHGWPCGAPHDSMPPPYFGTDAIAGRCLPIAVADGQGDAYTQADCSHPITGTWTCSATACPSPPVGLRADLTGCTTEGGELFTYGDATPSVFEQEQGACTPVAVGGGCQFHPAQQAQDLASLPALAESHPGAGRLSPLFRTALGDPRPLAEGRYQLWDNQVGTPCSPAYFVDGKVRCLSVSVSPINSFERVEYADAACTQRVVASAATCGEAPRYAQQYSVSGNVVYAAETQALFSVGAAVSGQIYASTQGGPCQLETTTSGASHWLVGDPVDPDALFSTLTDGAD
jgi:hypothetical protein